jgi:hypothetical protein
MADNYNRSNRLKNGNLKENIKKLRESNHEKVKEMIDRFYKIEPQKEKNSDCQENNHYKTLSGFFNIIGTKSPIQTQNKFTQLQTTKYKPNETWMKDTHTSMKKTHNLKIQTSADADQLFQLYEVYDEKKNASLMNDNEKESLFKTFHIDKSLNKNDQMWISKIFGNKTKSSLINFTKSQIGATTYYFDNIEKAFNKLKMNKIIYNSIMSSRTTKQYHKFTDRFDKEYERFIKAAQMPKIKEKRNNHIIDTNDVNGNVEVKTNTRTLSRLQIFEAFFEFHMIYLDENFTNRPSSRSMFSLNLIGCHLYLFGGMGNEKLCDVWKCDLRSI